jgi:hypothetical protein
MNETTRDLRGAQGAVLEVSAIGGLVQTVGGGTRREVVCWLSCWGEPSMKGTYLVAPDAVVRVGGVYDFSALLA